MVDKKKERGEVFTPNNIVCDILDSCGYTGSSIVGKHVIDNSCGDGAFLVEVVERYIAGYPKREDKVSLKEDLEKYIHGIEIDKINYDNCLLNLNKTVAKYGIVGVSWDIKCADALDINDYDAQMDYVVGNPPYVRVHNLNDGYEKVKSFKFAEKGMIDLFIAFFEIGFKMLNSNGKLSYIVPISCLTSNACESFRKYIKDNKNLFELYLLGHYQPFDVRTYTVIMSFDNSKKFETINFYKYNNDGRCDFVKKIKYQTLFVKNRIYVSENLDDVSEILNFNVKKKYVEVKNGFATLCDRVYISDSFDFDECVIDVVKASRGIWKKCIFPYDKSLKLIRFESIKDEKLKKYLLDNQEFLEKRSLGKDTQWYEFGRSQALNDVFKEKIVVNTTINSIESIRLIKVSAGQGAYSGLYILTEIPYEKIKDILCNERFFSFVKGLNKCKNNGYYSFSSKDLFQYLNYILAKEEGDG